MLPLHLSSWCTFRSRAIRVAALGIALVAPRALSAQGCPVATALGRDAHSYRSRGAVCDGRARVGWRAIGNAIVIVSIVGQVDPPTIARELYLYWKTPAGAAQQSLVLRARSVPPGRDYRMDASPALTGAPLVWPAGVMTNLGMDWSGVG